MSQGLSLVLSGVARCRAGGPGERLTGVSLKVSFLQVSFEVTVDQVGTLTAAAGRTLSQDHW